MFTESSGYTGNAINSIESEADWGCLIGRKRASPTYVPSKTLGSVPSNKITNGGGGVR